MIILSVIEKPLKVRCVESDIQPPRMLHAACSRMVNRGLENGNSNSHGARPVYSIHLDEQVDSDQWVVNKELSL